MEYFIPGEVIIHEHEVGECMYVVHDGEVCIKTVLIEEASGVGAIEIPITLATLTAGKHFGELALLSEDRVRSATVEAVAETVCVTIDRKTFWDVINPSNKLVATDIAEVYRQVKEQKAWEEFSRRKKKKERQIRRQFEQQEAAHVYDQDATHAREHLRRLSSFGRSAAAMNSLFDGDEETPEDYKSYSQKRSRQADSSVKMGSGKSSAATSRKLGSRTSSGVVAN